jgi:hypothetical protein
LLLWTPRASAWREREEHRGAIMDAIRLVEQRRPSCGLQDGGGEGGAQGAFSASGGAAGAVAINPGIRSRRPHRILKFIAFGSTGVIAAPLPKSPAGRVERTARIEKTDINYA